MPPRARPSSPSNNGGSPSEQNDAEADARSATSSQEDYERSLAEYYADLKEYEEVLLPEYLTSIGENAEFSPGADSGEESSPLRSPTSPRSAALARAKAAQRSKAAAGRSKVKQRQRQQQRNVEDDSSEDEAQATSSALPSSLDTVRSGVCAAAAMCTSPFSRICVTMFPLRNGSIGADKLATQISQSSNTTHS